MKRSDLADAVTDDGSGHYTPRFPKRGQCDLQCKKRGLSNLGLVESRALLRQAEFLKQRPARQRPQQGVAGGNRLMEDRFFGEQFPPHPVPLRSLSAEDETDPGHRCGLSLLGETGRRRALDVLSEPLAELFF